MQEIKKENSKSATNYVKYTAIVFQMIAIIGVFAFIGFKIDEKLQSAQPFITAVLSLLGVAIALYQVMRSLKSD